MAKTATNQARGTLRIVLFSCLMVVGVWIGGSVAGFSEPVTAAPHCQESECEHNHRWWWWDNDECVPNAGENTVCAPGEGDHCRTRACSDYHAPHPTSTDYPCDEEETTQIEECGQQ